MSNSVIVQLTEPQLLVLTTLPEIKNRTDSRSIRNDFTGWTKALSLPLAHPAQAFRTSSDNGQRCNQTPPYASYANLNAFLTFRTFGPATRQIRQTSRHHIQLLEGHFSGQHARLRHTALIVIVLYLPTAFNAKKQHSRQQYSAILARTTTEKLPLSLVFR